MPNTLLVGCSSSLALDKTLWWPLIEVILGSVHKVWKKLPQSLVKKYVAVGAWLAQDQKGCKISTLSITGKQKRRERIKNAVKAPVYDEFAIGGFKATK